MPNIWVMNFSKAINLYRHPLQRQKIDFSIPIRNFVYNFYTIWILKKTRNQSKLVVDLLDLLYLPSLLDVRLDCGYRRLRHPWLATSRILSKTYEGSFR